MEMTTSSDNSSISFFSCSQFRWQCSGQIKKLNVQQGHKNLKPDPHPHHCIQSKKKQKKTKIHFKVPRYVIHKTGLIESQFFWRAVHLEFCLKHLRESYCCTHL